MTPAQIVAAIRDLLVLAALAFVVYRIYADGENKVKLADVQAVQAQLTANAEKAVQYAQQARDAAIKHDTDMGEVRASIAAQRAPIRLQPPTLTGGTGHLSCSTTPTPSEPASAGGSREAPGVDLRPQLNAAELQIETWFAGCREALSDWPH